MKIVGVISSANRDGNSATLVREALRAAEAAGAATREIYLPECKIEFCTGCLRCMAEGRCHQPDDFESLRGALHEADGIILGAPTFGAAPNARMKNFMDRFGLFEYFTASLGGRYFAAISTASSPGTAAKVAKGMARLFAGGVFRRGYVSGSMGAKARPQGAVDAASLKKAAALGGKLAADLARGKKYPFQNLPGRILSRLMMKPMFRRAILDHKDGMMRGVHANLADRGLI